MKIFCATISLILGLYFLRNNLAFSIVISLIYVVFIFFRFNKKFAFILLSISIGGVFLSTLNIEYNSDENIYSGMVLEVKENYFIFQSHFERYYVYENNTDKEVGDFLTIYSEVEEVKFTTYESQFDFNTYLSNKGVKRGLSLKKYNVNFSNPIRIHSLKERFLDNFDEDAKAIVNALLFNEKDYSSSVLEQFSELNLLYLISLSGLYLHTLIAALTYLIGLKLSDKLSQIIPYILLFPLLIFSFPKVSILRIFVVGILKYVNDNFVKKKFNYLTLLSIAALFFLICDYHLAYQESFYIGFSLSLLTIFARNASRQFKAKKRKYLIPPIIYLLLLPVGASYKSSLHLLSFIFQTILTPFISLLFVSSLLSLVHIPIYGFINWGSNILIGIMKVLSVVDFKIPIAINDVFLVIYYLAMIVMLYLFESGRMIHLRNIAISLATFMLISMGPINNGINAVYFINVGQGDSILIQNHNYFVMIDTGGNINFDMAKETLIPFFNKKGIKHLNALITTHDDFDHSGAVNSLIENFKVYTFLNKRENFPYKVGNIELENINFYDGEANDSSLVFKLKFMNKKWIFTGDASIESEMSIINSGIDIDCDILKVGHHGSKTSTCEEFLNKTTPEEAIVSCGAKNKYGHPSKEVIERLLAHNIKIRRTDLEGTIEYKSLI